MVVVVFVDMKQRIKNVPHTQRRASNSYRKKKLNLFVRIAGNDDEELPFLLLLLLLFLALYIFIRNVCDFFNEKKNKYLVAS